MESDIAALKKTISSIPAKPKWNIIGKILISIGVFMLVLALCLTSLNGDAGIYYVFATIEIGVGIFVGIPRKATLEENLNNARIAQKNLEEKQAELDRLTKG